MRKSVSFAHHPRHRKDWRNFVSRHIVFLVKNEGVMFPPVSFRIPTLWHIRGRIEDVADILARPEDFPRWWGDVYLSVKTVRPGDSRGIGQRVAVHSKGWLPYRLDWEGTLVENHMPASWTVEATGDLVGRGVWTLTQRGETAEIAYDWSVRSDRLLFRVLAPLFRRLMISNHRWAMARGERGLQREMDRLSVSKCETPVRTTDVPANPAN